MGGRFGVTDISPVVECGRFAAKAVVGEHLPVTATLFREGHDKVCANVVLIPPSAADTAADPTGTDRAGDVATFVRMAPGAPGTDRWYASITPTEPGLWHFRLEVWSDPLSTWRDGLEKKLDAGQGPEDLANDLETGARLFDRAADETSLPSEGGLAGLVREAAAHLRDTRRDLAYRVGAALSPQVWDVVTTNPVRDLVDPTPWFPLWVDRERALFSSWYEFFPRSEGAFVPPPGSGEAPRSGTFEAASRRLPAVAAMGFDVVYLPPIHPVGRVNRKGPNNTLTPGPHDPGSPWAIGAAEGGHDAVHPDLGTIEDFDAFVARARELGMEVALDLALQCAPDHPWVSAHPEWFTTKPDGTIAYAENPPKKYQDIYPINFDNDPEGIYQEVKRVVRYWMEHGVRVFRVDNPHTKPISFWNRLIEDIRTTDPDVLWLAEAFTKPPMMHGLAKRGFTQSYTYFTWRTAKWELEEYGRELAEHTADFLRPNFFVNTPDILHASLQHGGPPMFKVRAVLASTMSPSWGVYSGYELFEHVAVREGSEEYLDSEKYAYRPRDYHRAEREGRSLAPYLTRLNAVRRSNPALQTLRNLRFHAADNDAVMVYSKQDADSGNTILVVVNLDTHHTQSSWLRLNMPDLGLDWHERFLVRDLISGGVWDWGEHSFVQLDPYAEPAHILSVGRYL